MKSFQFLTALCFISAACACSGGKDKHPLAPDDEIDSGADTGNDGTSTDTGGGSDGADGATETSETSGDAPVDSGDAASDLGDAGDGKVDAVVLPAWTATIYANSSATLYRFDATTSTLTAIGPFVTESGTAIADMLDIAVNAEGAMYAISFGRLYRVYLDGTKVSCIELATLATDFAGLTFVPAGSLDPTSEVLVAVTADGAWTRIDLVSGDPAAKLTVLGPYGGWSSGGDSVAAAGNVYASANKEGATDHLVLINPKTGGVSKDLGDTGQKQLRGLGYWGGFVYGFSLSGDVYKIDPLTAAATLVAGTTKPAGGWAGGAVTTTAK